jgi:hypothetical protein
MKFLRSVIRKQKRFYLFGAPYFGSNGSLIRASLLNFFTHLPLKFENF